MGLGDELRQEVDAILKTKWESRDGCVVPSTETIQLGNDAVKLKGTVFYADLADSSGLVQGHKSWFAAEVYKSYLACACRVIRNHGGEVTAFDGDRVMAVFIGDIPNTSAAKAGLKLNWTIEKILNPKIKQAFPDATYAIRHAVGIDTSDLFIARTGIRGSNDLVWVGRAANVAAKMCGLRHGGNYVYITKAVLDKLNDSSKYGGGDSKQWMWESLQWNGETIYRSGWIWPAD
ncbi:MAG: adenylate/guanylate cyclase domain-containing protein [Verrucomicrobia bacterium]|nr:adenylate/guanylate cyclase domain-containing protein [Verrucomicrobiota bacterium]